MSIRRAVKTASYRRYGDRNTPRQRFTPITDPVPVIRYRGVQFRIGCPSAGRASRVGTHLMLPFLHLIVNESEYDDYERELGGKVASITPVTGDRPIARARNLVIENVWQDGDDFLVMMDDDVRSLRRNLSMRGETIYDPRQVIHVLAETACLASYAGTRLFGYKNDFNPISGDKQRPFELRERIDGGAFGLLDRELRYDTNLWVYEDGDLSMEIMAQDRMTMQDCRYGFRHWQRVKGGCTDYRTAGRMQADHEYLKRKWGRKHFGELPAIELDSTYHRTGRRR